MIHDGLWDPYNDFHMGSAAERCARRAEVRARSPGRIRRRELSTRAGGAASRGTRRGDRADHRQGSGGRQVVVARTRSPRASTSTHRESEAELRSRRDDHGRERIEDRRRRRGGDCRQRGDTTPRSDAARADRWYGDRRRAPRSSRRADRRHPQCAGAGTARIGRHRSLRGQRGVLVRRLATSGRARNDARRNVMVARSRSGTRSAPPARASWRRCSRPCRPRRPKRGLATLCSAAARRWRSSSNATSERAP